MSKVPHRVGTHCQQQRRLDRIRVLLVADLDRRSPERRLHCGAMLLEQSTQVPLPGNMIRAVPGGGQIRLTMTVRAIGEVVSPFSEVVPQTREFWVPVDGNLLPDMPHLTAWSGEAEPKSEVGFWTSVTPIAGTVAYWNNGEYIVAVISGVGDLMIATYVLRLVAIGGRAVTLVLKGEQAATQVLRNRGLALGEFFYTKRSRDDLRTTFNQFWGRHPDVHLSHMLFMNRWSTIPLQVRNAGYNLAPLPPLRFLVPERYRGVYNLNAFMGFARRWRGEHARMAARLELAMQGVWGGTHASAIGGDWVSNRVGDSFEGVWGWLGGS